MEALDLAKEGAPRPRARPCIRRRLGDAEAVLAPKRGPVLLADSRSPDALPMTAAHRTTQLEQRKVLQTMFDSKAHCALLMGAAHHGVQLNADPRPMLELMSRQNPGVRHDVEQRPMAQ